MASIVFQSGTEKRARLPSRVITPEKTFHYVSMWCREGGEKWAGEREGSWMKGRR